ncbi:type 1 glutamine amidotransferase [Sneathiella aquimaris]|uniref:type 1 glutamine amidotransferase n=1 Tax=Sneathiella aquimaris TaxID=2599305 RepID=UPI001469A3BA|nr:type 1 glutamine amidotransferase [Sneathiella aquimaris]
MDFKQARFLVLDGYPKEHRGPLADNQGTLAGELYATLIRDCAPGCQVDIAFPADLDSMLPSGDDLLAYDGVVWTGSSLTIHDEQDERVIRQIRFAQAVFENGMPMFGSCWAAQMAVTAAGGTCAKNPRGREFGLARKICLTGAGRGHPMFSGKKSVFDGFTSHEDEITHLPEGGVLLASNDFTSVQAVDVTYKGGSFWAVQYHPEYDLHEIASLCRWRREGLTAQGNFASIADADLFIEKMETLHLSPERKDLRWQLGVDQDVLNPDIRCQELRNWLDYKIKPNIKNK